MPYCWASTKTSAPVGSADWHDQLQQEIGKIDREQQQEQSRSDANEARLAELQKQRDDLERERQKLAAQAKASSSAGADRNTSSAVTSAGEAPATPAKAKIRHIPARIEHNNCAAPRYPNASRQLNEEGRVVIGYRSEEHTSELQSLMRNSYAVFCLKN